MFNKLRKFPVHKVKLKKQEIRRLFTEKRQLLTDSAYAELNKRLLEKFLSLDFLGVKCIHLFLPIVERREPDTFLLIAWLKSVHPAIKRVYPKADFADNSMKHFVDDAALQIALSTFGIPEPISGQEVAVTDLDMVLVPLLAFDQQGRRVGYGKGFYDRFLAQCRPGTRFVGLSLFEPVDIIEDADALDIRLHACVTPDRIWEF